MVSGFCFAKGSVVVESLRVEVSWNEQDMRAGAEEETRYKRRNPA